QGVHLDERQSELAARQAQRPAAVRRQDAARRHDQREGSHVPERLGARGRRQSRGRGHLMRCAGMLVACLWLLAPTAFAQRVLVRSFDGPGAARVRDAVLQALAKDGAERVREAEADAAAEQSGSDLATASGRVTVARKLKLAAFIEGEVSAKKKKQFEAHVRV